MKKGTKKLPAYVLSPDEEIINLNGVKATRLQHTINFYTKQAKFLKEHAKWCQEKMRQLEEMREQKKLDTVTICDILARLLIEMQDRNWRERQKAVDELKQAKARQPAPKPS